MEPLNRSRFVSFLRFASSTNVGKAINRTRALALLQSSRQEDGDYAIDGDTFDKLEAFCIVADGGQPPEPIQIYAFTKLVNNELRTMRTLRHDVGARPPGDRPDSEPAVSVTLTPSRAHGRNREELFD